MVMVLLPASASAGVPTRQLPVVIGDRAVSRKELRHSDRLMRYIGGDREDAVRFVVEYRWMRGEAARRGVVVTRRELRRAYRRDMSLFGTKAFRRFLRETHQSRADVRVRAYREEYAFRLREFATAGVPDDQRNAALDAFGAEYRAYWQPLTRCTPGFFVADICTGSA